MSESLGNQPEEPDLRGQTVESQYYLRQLAENANDILWVTDLQGRNLYVSPSVTRVLGYSVEVEEDMQRTRAETLTPASYQAAQVVLVEELQREASGEADPNWSTTVEVEVYHKDGFIVPLEVRMSFLRDDQGQAVGLLGVARDITARKQAEERLKQQAHDLGERVKELNCLYGVARLVETEGLSLEEILPGAVELIPPSWQYPEATCARLTVGEQTYEAGACGPAVARQTAPVVVNGEEIGTLEVAYVEEFPEADEGPFLKEERHLIEAFAERLGKIIERHQVQEALVAERERLSVTLHSIGDGVIATDTEGRVVLVNQVAEDLTGWSQQEAEGQPLEMVFHIVNEKTHEPCEDPVAKVLQTGEIIGLGNDTVLVARDGTERVIADSASPICDEAGSTLGVILVFRDVTERKRAEEALRESEELFRSVFEGIQDIFYRTDADSRIVLLSPSVQRLAGYSPEELVGRPAASLFADSAQHEHLLEQFRRDRQVTDVEITLQDKDGTEVPTSITGHLRVDDQGRPAGTEGILRDITERKQDERRLAELVKRLQAVNEIARALTSTLDPASILGIVLREVGRVVPGDRISVVSCEPGNHRLRIMAIGGEGEADSMTGERAEFDAEDTWIGQVIAEKTSQYIPDLAQREKPVEQHLYQMGIRSVVLVPIVCEDLCLGSLNIGREEVDGFSEQERELLESLTPYVAAAINNARAYDQLRQARQELEAAQGQMVQIERLRAIGEVAGGVAHDFNNVLGTILGRTQVLLAQTKDEAMQESLELMQTAARLGRETVKRIQRFMGRQEEEAYVPVNLDQLVEEALDMTRYRWKDEAQREGITINTRKQLGAGPTIRANAAEVREVLINLITNACDAMPEGGTLSVATTVEEGWATVEIADSGMGMNEETREQVFDLFFTTKGSENSGLGLTISQGIIQRHGGRIELESSPGEGTVFKVCLPLTGEEEEARSEETELTTSGPLRVLIVDDDSMLLGTMQEALKILEYDAATAGDGAAAIQQVEAEHFDVVITDLGMPGMSGWQVAEEVKQISPQTYVIILTGWGDSIEPNQYVDDTLAKPVEMDTLRQVLGKLASRRAA